MIRPWNTACNRPDIDRLQTEIGERLALARTILECSQEAVAERIGCSRGYLARCESGRSIPDPTMLLNFQNAYGFTIQWLADGSTVGLPAKLIAKIGRLSARLAQRESES